LPVDTVVLHLRHHDEDSSTLLILPWTPAWDPAARGIRHPRHTIRRTASCWHTAYPVGITPGECGHPWKDARFRRGVDGWCPNTQKPRQRRGVLSCYGTSFGSVGGTNPLHTGDNFREYRGCASLRM